MPIYTDPSGRAAQPRTLRWRGLATAAVLATAGMLIYQQGTGKFVDTFTLTVVANSIGEGLAPGAEVKFRGLAIGTVSSLRSAGYNKQTMTVTLNPRQAQALTADTTARFTSSNAFGTSAVELVSSGGGGRLASGQTLEMGSDVQSSSVTGLLRQGQKLNAVIDSPEFTHIIELLRRHANVAAPLTKANFDLLAILADSQRVPVSQTIAQVGEMITAANGVVPLFELANPLLDRLDFLSDPAGAEHTNIVLQQISRLLNDGGQILNRNNYWIIGLIDGVMNLAIPAAYAAGSLAPAYDRLSGLLDRTSAAFPVQNGKVRMQIQIILDAMPGLAAALPPGTPPTGGGR